MTQELAVRDNQGLSPIEFGLSIDTAQAKAKRLTTIVEDRKLYLQIGDRKHLQVEAWQILGMGYGLTVKSQVSELLRDAEGNIIGVKASADVVNGNGIIVGGGESYCFAAEQGKGKQMVSQLAGMAQTRACSRAFRQILSWVAELAGYAPTPAEEMHGELKERLESESKYYCAEHDKEWFKRGNMRGFAHPIDSGGWCNMPGADYGPIEQSAKTATEKPVEATDKAERSPGVREVVKATKDDIEDLTVQQLEAGCNDFFKKLGLVAEKKKAWVAKNVPGIVGIPPVGLAKEQWQALYDRLRLEWEQK